MKKLIFVLSALATLAVSCRESDSPCDQGSGNVIIAFTPEPLTRAFFDNTAKAESWEKKVNTATAFVFDPVGRLVVRKDLTQTEIASGQVSFSVTRDVLDRECSFYVAANTSFPDTTPITDWGSLVNTMDVNISEYNGTAYEVMYGSVRPEGFVMTGKAVKTISQYGSTTLVAVSIKRSVAKIAFRYSIDEEFYSSSGGSSIRIDKVKLGTGYHYVKMFEDYLYPAPDNRNFTHTQETLGNGALFYVYPQAAQDELSGYITLHLDGMYDKDGNFGTTDDQTKVQYQLLIEGSGSGEIKRNGYYCIETTIKGVLGQDATATLTASDWEYPFTQNVNLGK